jgi:hypothetical protein
MAAILVDHNSDGSIQLVKIAFKHFTFDDRLIINEFLISYIIC